MELGKCGSFALKIIKIFCALSSSESVFFVVVLFDEQTSAALCEFRQLHFTMY